MVHSKHRYISKRYRNSKLVGFVVRVPGFKNQSFYGHNYNGLSYALQEALYYRNDLMKTYNAQPDYTGNLVHKNNKSGMVGIVETDKHIDAIIKNKNKHTKITYSISVYGYDTALQLAINSRIESKSIGGICSPMPNRIKSVLNG